MSLRQQLPRSPVPDYRSTSRQTDRSMYSTASTSVPRNQTGYYSTTGEWAKTQPDWRDQNQERFAAPLSAPPEAYGGDFITSSGWHSGGGFDPKYDHINNAPPTRDAKRRGVYNTMCCGSGWGVGAWIVGATVFIAILIVVLLKLVNLNALSTNRVTSSNDLQSIAAGSTYTTTVTATPSTSTTKVSSVTTTTETSVSQVIVSSTATVTAFTTAPPDKRNV